jgi:hypothetical protein
MENKIAITTAFKLRNQIKERISDLTSLIEEMPASYPSGSVLDRESFDGLDINTGIARVEEIQDVLTQFNILIDEANSTGPARQVLKINAVNDTLNRYTYWLNKIQRAPKEDAQMNRVTGEVTKIQYTQVGDVSQTRAKIRELKKTKVKFENELSELNSKTFVDISGIRQLIELILE